MDTFCPWRGRPLSTLVAAQRESAGSPQTAPGAALKGVGSGEASWGADSVEVEGFT